LSGNIPPELGNLAKLQYLWIFANEISGNIPPQLGNLSNLEGLFLGLNRLSGNIPPELGNLANLKILCLFLSHLNGSIPRELGNLANLQVLWLSANQFSGGIPPELANLVNLQILCLASNKLSGNIPSDLTNLTNLWDDWSDFKWNALYTEDDTLRMFLNLKQAGGNWENTQTIAPTDITAPSATTTSITFHWLPIIYTSDTGGYRVFYSTTPRGAYSYFDMTTDKTIPSLTVTGLHPGTTYYCVVQTRTNPHKNNLNTVDSLYSTEISASTLYPLALTSPNGGELWGLRTIRDITWTSAELSGNIRLELLKADKKLGNIAVNIPILNGNYAWNVANYTLGAAPTGNDYKINIITDNGLYHDNCNAPFSIVKTSLTLTLPRGGENWKIGSQKDITWNSLALMGNVKLLLLKGGVQVGIIAQGIPIANGKYTWTVGKHMKGLAAAGSNYTVKICCEDNRFYNSGSNFFKIW
ncbi:MAG TPA: Ser-Thr-rich GPI-anchored membrane family protein, partial [Candidatus Deferrimicrobium sp.]|nr:Ser-Thr-rich GPI-anchored membrane family protein [Candidatus Deferrimicrobium sp.]